MIRPALRLLLVLACFAPALRAADAAAVEEVPGMMLPRPDGTFLNLRVEGGRFTVYFYDAEKKEQIGTDLVRGRIRWRSATTRERDAILNRGGDGRTLQANQPVNRPYTYHFWLTLFNDGASEPAESYSGRYHEPLPGDGASVSVYDLLPEPARS